MIIFKMTETQQNFTKSFKYSFPACTNEELMFKLEVPVEIPYDGSTRELVQRIINMFHIPVYLEEELNEKLAQFVADETKCYHNNRDEGLINQLKNGEINVEGVVKNWEKLYKENVVEFAEQKGTSDEEVFAAAYHKLVHSPALETILQVESSYARTVMDTLRNRDEDIRQLTQRQTEEMEKKISLLNTTTTEEEINETAARHFEEQSLVAGRWGSQADALWQAQRARHRAWLMATLEDYHTSNGGLNTPNNSPLATFPELSLLHSPAAPAPAPAARRLDESFTIHLGSQLKQTHNIRLIAMDPMDLCNIYDDRAGGGAHTALTVYSTELSGRVALGAPGDGGAGAAALRPARASTDHHFPHVDHQLREIDALIKEPVEKRNSARAAGGARGRPARGLQPGDVFVTRHANLADVHVLFHLVTDDSSLRTDITSRHPAILGLRNILKAACANDITTISLPILLVNELTEEMTEAWCLRRAELVLKCVKGFVLEGAGGGGAELRELRLLAPPLPALFALLAALVPAVFRLASPLKLHAHAHALH